MKFPSPTPRPFLLLLFLALIPRLEGSEILHSSPGRSHPLGRANPFARPSGMGSAFVGVADDATALFTNPAGLSGLRDAQILLNSHLWLAQTHQESFVAAFPGPRGSGGFALAGSFLDYGTFEGRDGSGFPSPDYQASRLGLRAGWGRQWAKGLSLGAGINATRSNLADRGQDFLAADFGALVRVTGRLTVGLAYNQLGSTEGEPAASVLQGGASYRFPWGPSGGLLAAASAGLRPEADDSFQLGLEYSARDLAFLRAGYQGSSGDEGIQGLSGLSAGAGVNLWGLGLDYAFLPHGDLGDSHRISLGLRFNNTPRKDAPPQAAGAPGQKSQGTAGHSLENPKPRIQAAPQGGTQAAMGSGTGEEKATARPEGPVKDSPSSAAPLPTGRDNRPRATADPDPKPHAGTVPSSMAASHQAPGLSALADPRALPDKPPGTKGDSLVLEFDMAPDSVAPGLELEGKGKYREAAQSYHDALRRNPRDSSAWWALGNLYKRFDRKADAVLCYGRLLLLDPGNREVADWLAKYKESKP